MYMVICNKFQITGDGTQAGATQEPDTAIDLAGSQRDAPSLIESDIDNLNAVLDCEIAQNTLKNYRIQWKNFNSWALRRGIVALPADPVQVAAYLAERLERHGHRPATLRVAASAIAFAHRAAGLDNPCARPQVKRTLRGATPPSRQIPKAGRGAHSGGASRHRVHRTHRTASARRPTRKPTNRSRERRPRGRADSPHARRHAESFRGRRADLAGHADPAGRHRGGC